MMLMMTIYETLQNLEGPDKHQSYKGAGGELATKRFNYREVFGNHFNYRHQVYNDKNQLHYCISVRTWAKKYWPDWCHA